MRKKKRFIFFTCILLSVCFSSPVHAEYYENHVDRGDYCMQAKDICITDTQMETWLKDGILQEKLLEMSRIFTNQFHPSDSTRYWTEYTGDYEMDIKALEHLEIPVGKTEKIVPINIHLLEKESIYVTVHVKVMGTKQGLPEQKNENTVGSMDEDDTHGREKELHAADSIEDAEEVQEKQQPSAEAEIISPKNKEGPAKDRESHMFYVWLLMTFLALFGYGRGLYSDFKVLKKYKKKLEQREERQLYDDNLR